MEMNDSLSRDTLLIEAEKRFRLVPNFCVSTPDAPEVIERLWDFAKAAYLDNPLPALFKERLFVYLSRFCEVRKGPIRNSDSKRLDKSSKLRRGIRRWAARVPVLTFVPRYSGFVYEGQSPRDTPAN